MSTFLDLPAELRKQVYDLVISNHDNNCQAQCFQTTRQIRAEALLMFYESHVFKFRTRLTHQQEHNLMHRFGRGMAASKHSDNLVGFIRAVSAENARAIRKVCFVFLGGRSVYGIPHWNRLVFLDLKIDPNAPGQILTANISRRTAREDLIKWEGDLKGFCASWVFFIRHSTQHAFTLFLRKVPNFVELA